MPVNATKEITTLWRNLHGAQDEICKTFYRWRQAAIEIAGPEAKTIDIALKAAEIFGKEIGKSFLPRLNWLKGQEAFMGSLAGLIAGSWANEGAVTQVEKGEKANELIIKCTRDPWPSVAKDYGVPMEEVALTREKILQTILEDVSAFFCINLGIEMLKAIPRGHGLYIFRLYEIEG
jgi:hypothetical protein